MSAREWLRKLGFTEVRPNYFESTSVINPKAVNDGTGGQPYCTISFNLVRKWLFWFQLTDFKTYDHRTSIERIYSPCHFSRANLTKYLRGEVPYFNERWIHKR